MNLVLRKPWTVERFLAWEDTQERRHEFDGVQIVEMTGGSRAHQRIVLNLARLLEDDLDPGRWDVVQEMRLEVAGKVRYPDVAVVAGRIANATSTLQDAVVLFEVLSADTADTDRHAKRDEYAHLAGIRHYVLLEQDRIAATALARVADGWAEIESTHGCLNFPELSVALPLASIYHGLGLEPG